jgi:hypothetical protein
MTAYFKVGGVYRSVPNAAMYLRNYTGNYTDKPIIGGYVKVGGGYRQFHIGSDPVTYYFDASNSRAARGTSWASSSQTGGASVLRQGRVTTNYPWFGVAEFNGSAYYTTSSLNTLMNTRPYVVSARLRLTRITTAHGYYGGSPVPGGWGDIVIGKYNAALTAVSPHPGSTNFTYYGFRNFPGRATDAFDLGETAYIDLAYNGVSHAQQLIDHVRGGGALSVANTTNNGSTGDGLQRYAFSEDTDYFFYNGYDQAYGPFLEVTLDYVAP